MTVIPGSVVALRTTCTYMSNIIHRKERQFAKKMLDLLAGWGVFQPLDSLGETKLVARTKEGIQEAFPDGCNSLAANQPLQRDDEQNITKIHGSFPQQPDRKNPTQKKEVFYENTVGKNNVGEPNLVCQDTITMKTTSDMLPSRCPSSAGVSSELVAPTTVLGCPHSSLPVPEVLAAAPLPPSPGTEKLMRRLQKDNPSWPAKLQHGQHPDPAMDVAVRHLVHRIQVQSSPARLLCRKQEKDRTWGCSQRHGNAKH